MSAVVSHTVRSDTIKTSEGFLVTTVDGRWIYQAWSWGSCDMGRADDKADGLKRAVAALRSFGVVL